MTRLDPVTVGIGASTRDQKTLDYRRCIDTWSTFQGSLAISGGGLLHHLCCALL